MDLTGMMANRDKCEKRGISVQEIEVFLKGQPEIAPDLKHSISEPRFLAVGKIDGRPVFVVFTYREKPGKDF